MSRHTLDPKLAKAAQELMTYAMDFPGASVGRPWGDFVYKIKNKSFLGLALDAARLRVTVKLAATQGDALALPFTEPTHHGLGQHGWVTGVFTPGTKVPIDLMKAWIDESFSAVAPQRPVVPKVKPAKAKLAKPKPAKPKPAKAKPAKPKPAKAKLAKLKPAKAKPKPKAAKKPPRR